ncbi:MAG: response regulator transcription factor [Gammaproteobacteria bacterium]|nr:response regulator transcription factor [Gammaproteobacteria bacterium]
MAHLLLIDDDERLAELLSRYFERFQLTMDSALTPSAGLQRLHSSAYDLVILDVMLPEQDGFAVCKSIRKFSAVPIIMLTARGEVTDRVVGLELGADDYLAKPFEPRELVARIQNILKRVSRASPVNAVVKFEHLTIDLDTHQVLLDNVEVSFSASEYQFLTLLAQQPNKVFTRDELLNELKGIDADIYTRSIDILVSRVRHKIAPHEFIKTVRGVGYCFAGKPL